MQEVGYGKHTEKSCQGSVTQETLLTKRMNNLGPHTRSDLGEKPNECKQCSETFTEENSLKRHTRNHSAMTPHECIQCGKRFTVKWTLRRHVLAHSVEKPYKCKQCSKTFALKSKMDAHNRVHSGEKPHKCKKCAKQFTADSTDNALKVQTRLHSGDKPYECGKCRKIFSWKSSLTKHNRVIHSGEKPYGCNCCEKKFTERSSMYVHKRTHSGLKPYKCEQCGKTFASKGTLRYHIRIHTGDLPHECKHCNKRFRALSSLRSHARVHSGGKLHACNVCEKILASVNSLKAHMFSHVGLKPYGCVQCEKRFPTSQNLGIHNRIHSGEKPYKCTQCEIRFNSKSNLRRHMRGHSAIKQYVCIICGREFRDTTKLKRHIFIHSGLKPHECEQCHKKFALKDSLVYHNRTHSGEKPYECDHCNKRFSVLSNLKRHILIHSSTKSLDLLIRDSSTSKTEPAGDAPRQAEEEGHHYRGRTNRCSTVSSVRDDTHIDAELQPYGREPCVAEFCTSIYPEKRTQSHSSAKLYICEHCMKRFATVGALKRHALSTHSRIIEKSFVCVACSKGFSTGNALNRHARIHSVDKPFSTEQLSSSLLTGESLKPNIPVEPVNEKFECKQCHKVLSSRSNLSRHVRIHSVDKPFLTEQLSCSLLTGESLKPNIPIEPVKAKFECKQCHKVLSSRSNLSRHVLIHSVDEQFSTDQHKPYRYRYEPRREHSKRVDSLNACSLVTSHAKPYECSKCCASFHSSAYLQMHFETHSNETPMNFEKDIENNKGTTVRNNVQNNNSRSYSKKFECKQCHKVLSSRSNLCRHVRIHSVDEPFSTEQHKPYRYEPRREHSKRVDSLNACSLVTSHAKPYECSKCCASFHSSAYLQMHFETHSNETPMNFEKDIENNKGTTVRNNVQNNNSRSYSKKFECKQCHKVLSSRSNLCRHVRIHSVDEPFSTEQHKPYRYEPRREHSKRVDSLNACSLVTSHAKPYECSKCCASFHSSAYLQMHFETHSNETPMNFEKDIENNKGTTVRNNVQNNNSRSYSKKFECKQCHKVLSSRSNLCRHVRIHSVDEPFSTEQHKPYRYEPRREHSKRVDSLNACSLVTSHAKPYECSKCCASFHSSAYLQMHFETHSNETPMNFEKDIENNKGTTVRNNVQNNNSRSYSKKFECKQCHKVLSSRSNLCRHVRIHSVDEPFSTEQHKPYRYEPRREHSKRVDSLNACSLVTSHAKPYECSKCCASFHSSAYLQMHFETHSNETPMNFEKDIENNKGTTVRNNVQNNNSRSYSKKFECKQCHKVLSSRSNLCRHVRIHSVDEPFSTEQHKPYRYEPRREHSKRVDSLNACSLVTSHANPYECSKCCASFHSSAYLQMHFETHSNETPMNFEKDIENNKGTTVRNNVQNNNSRSYSKKFECKQCHKVLSSRSNLCRHVRIHSVDEPFSTEQHKPYRYEPRREHSKRVDSLNACSLVTSHAKPYECSKCCASFHSSAYLQMHFETHSNETPMNFEKNIENKKGTTKRKSVQSYSLRSHSHSKRVAK